MAGTFILSFDCEGKWGVADHLDATIHRLLEDKNLRAAYRQIFNVLAEYNISATFAVVGLFKLPMAELKALPLDEVAIKLPYTKYAIEDIKSGTKSGWNAPWLSELVGLTHEWATHGVTHTPFSDMSADQVEYELSLVPFNREKTIIFPRNAVNHLEALKARGIIAYRQARIDTPIRRLLSELQPYATSDEHALDANPLAIPAGRFINWKSGLRAWVPSWLTIQRAASIMDHAIAGHGVAHFWTHPENIATAPETLESLRGICREAARRRDQGRLNIQTQLQYSQDHSKR